MQPPKLAQNKKSCEVIPINFKEQVEYLVRQCYYTFGSLLLGKIKNIQVNLNLLKKMEELVIEKEANQRMVWVIKPITSDY
jgi:hypothetical protein